MAWKSTRGGSGSGERKALPTNLILDREGRKAAGFAGFPGREVIMKKVNALLGDKG